ncbi:MAG: hypothetical protein WA215_09870 [Candidatus Cybelea sp.]
MTNQGFQSRTGDVASYGKRLANFIAVVMPREVRRAPAEICLAIAEITASALTPAYVKIIADHKTLGVGDETCGCGHMLKRQHRHVLATHSKAAPRGMS